MVSPQQILVYGTTTIPLGNIEDSVTFFRLVGCWENDALGWDVVLSGWGPYDCDPLLLGGGVLGNTSTIRFLTSVVTLLLLTVATASSEKKINSPKVSQCGLTSTPFSPNFFIFLRWWPHIVWCCRSLCSWRCIWEFLEYHLTIISLKYSVQYRNQKWPNFSCYLCAW